MTGAHAARDAGTRRRRRSRRGVGAAVAASRRQRTVAASPRGSDARRWTASRSLGAPDAASRPAARACQAARSPALSSAYTLARTSGWSTRAAVPLSSKPADAVGRLPPPRVGSRPASRAAASSCAPSPSTATARASERDAGGNRRRRVRRLRPTLRGVTSSTSDRIRGNRLDPVTAQFGQELADEERIPARRAATGFDETGLRHTAQLPLRERSTADSLSPCGWTTRTPGTDASSSSRCLSPSRASPSLTATDQRDRPSRRAATPGMPASAATSDPTTARRRPAGATAAASRGWPRTSTGRGEAVPSSAPSLFAALGCPITSAPNSARPGEQDIALISRSPREHGLEKLDGRSRAGTRARAPEPRALATRTSPATLRAAPRSDDLPIPGGPSITSAPPAPSRAPATTASIVSSSRPRSTSGSAFVTRHDRTPQHPIQDSPPPADAEVRPCPPAAWPGRARSGARQRLPAWRLNRRPGHLLSLLLLSGTGNEVARFADHRGQSSWVRFPPPRSPHESGSPRSREP